MRSKIFNIREQLAQFRYDHGLIQQIECSKADRKAYLELLKSGGKLPNGVFQSDEDHGEVLFYTIYKADLSKDELEEYLSYKKIRLLKSIKDCAVFFVVLTVIALVLALIGVIR